MQKLRKIKINNYVKLINANRKAIFLLLGILFLVYFLHSLISAHYRETYLKSERLSKKLASSSSSNSNCLKSKTYLKENDTLELNRFLEFLDNFKYKHFLCFSTLFYAVKIENYSVYREKELTVKAINDLMEAERRKKCLLESHKRENEQLIINMCILNDKEHENFCNYYTLMNANCKCSYNYLNGEYELDCSTRIRVIIHEYKIIKKKYLVFNKENYDEISILNAGLIGYLFKLNLNLPTYLFYDDENNDSKNIFYLNYANNVFRLPSDVINYLMIFYTNLWYI